MDLVFFREIVNTIIELGGILYTQLRELMLYEVLISLTTFESSFVGVLSSIEV